MAKATKEPKFQIRQLTDDDLFNVLDIFAECSDDLKDLLIDIDKDNVKEKGFKLVMTLINAVTGKNKDLIRGLLASLIGKTLEEYKKMPLGTTIELLVELKENEEVKKFFTTVSSMVTTQKS